MGSIGVFLLLILLVGIGVGLWSWSKKKSQENSGKQDKNAGKGKEDSIMNVGPGGFIHLSTVGPEKKDYDISITSKHVYRESGSEWYELEGETQDGKVYIDVEEDDELEVSLQIKRLKFSDIGISVEDLKQMESKDEGKIEFEGKTYNFEEAGKAEFLKNEREENAERLIYWDFETEDEDFLMGLEQWGDNEFKAYIAVPVEPRQISIYSTQETTE